MSMSAEMLIDILIGDLREQVRQKEDELPRLLLDVLKLRGEEERLELAGEEPATITSERKVKEQALAAANKELKDLRSQVKYWEYKKPRIHSKHRDAVLEYLEQISRSIDLI